MPLEDVIETMRKSVLIRPDAPLDNDPRRLPFLIRFNYRDRAKAQQTLSALTARFIEANLAGAIHYDSAGGTMQLIAPASVAPAGDASSPGVHGGGLACGHADRDLSPQTSGKSLPRTDRVNDNTVNARIAGHRRLRGSA